MSGSEPAGVPQKAVASGIWQLRTVSHMSSACSQNFDQDIQPKREKGVGGVDIRINPNFRRPLRGDLVLAQQPMTGERKPRMNVQVLPPVVLGHESWIRKTRIEIQRRISEFNRRRDTQDDAGMM
ncbi:hypothetical protein Vi05172_g4851 [Venturia inaequalis]|nr:hypothetical protein Vi05172_g4851 [Venturia inaequalis]